MAAAEQLRALQATLADQALPAYERGDAAEGLFQVWLGVAGDFTQGKLEGGAEACARFTAHTLGTYLDERSGAFSPGADDYFVRLLMQQFEQVLGLFVAKPKLAAVVQCSEGAPLLVWLGAAACPALGGAALGGASPPSHRVEYMQALAACFALEGIALTACAAGLDYDPLEPLLARIMLADEDPLARAAATELLVVILRHPGRAARCSAGAARVLAAGASARAAFSLVWRLGGLSDAEALASAQRRCSLDRNVAVEALASLCDAVGDSGGSGVDAARDCLPICALLRACSSGSGERRPGPSAEEGYPPLPLPNQQHAALEATSSGGDGSAGVAPMDLFRAVLGRCPDRPEYLQCLLEPGPAALPVEAVELLSAHSAAIPEALWVGIILPFAAQVLHGSHRARRQRSGGGGAGVPGATGAVRQETALLIRDCAMAFYPPGRRDWHGTGSPQLGEALFKCLLSAMSAGYTQAERFAECAAQVCAMHLSRGSTRWLVEMLGKDESADRETAELAGEVEDPVELARWGATVSGAVALALLGLDSGDGTGVASGAAPVQLDEPQTALALSAFAGVPVSHKTLHLFTVLGRDHRVLALHSDAVGVLLVSVSGWIGGLVTRLSAPPPSYVQAERTFGGGVSPVAAAPVVIAAVDLDLLSCVIEMLRVVVPHLHPANALLLFDLALKVLALLQPADRSEASGYTDVMLESVIRCIAGGGGVACISAAALGQACMISGVRTRSLLAQLLPEHMLSDPAPMVRTEALRTLGALPSVEWVARCGHTVLTASIARAVGSSDSDSDAGGGGGGGHRVDEVLRLLHLDVREAEFEVDQLQLAIAAAPCLAEVAQVPGQLGRQAAERLAAFSRLSQMSDSMREPHPAIAAAEQRVPEVHQSIYASQDDGIRVGATGGSDAAGDGGGEGGLELKEMAAVIVPQAACVVAVPSAPEAYVVATPVDPLSAGDVMQAMVQVSDGVDAQWAGIQRLATARYVVEGQVTDDVAAAAAGKDQKSQLESFANPAGK